eukprot:CAMPEP_0179009994 /NCGR_PEP_ID=MMETSP0795-20121207/16565_1 /TAXON_ID=88552 /ORGANISM="Amoebophrya sp., Strain Ameob2" /LENGTH=98 /DNA_ID=CAMNT_0020705221 /DNA_START=110 /DNA_END=404 /DNA_ORIENTATION=+
MCDGVQSAQDEVVMCLNLDLGYKMILLRGRLGLHHWREDSLRREEDPRGGQNSEHYQNPAPDTKSPLLNFSAVVAASFVQLRADQARNQEAHQRHRGE